jgi:tartrate-resistant acid phosphatase type 5
MTSRSFIISCHAIIGFMQFWAVAPSTQAQAAQASIEFEMVGDWGGIDHEPYFTPAQLAGAKGMSQSQFSPRFILGLGDNFYSTGIDTDENSERFKNTWAQVYNPSVPWYLCAGNHDYKGNVSAQIAYTADDPLRMWTFPDYNYNFVEHWTEKGSEFSLEVIMIDTVILVGMAEEQNDRTKPAYFHQPTGPTDVALAEAQWDWLEGVLRVSSADFIIVAGHYPVYSVCNHGPTQALEDRLLPLLQQYDAHYMSGHDHCASHIVDDKGVNHILNGMGDECCYGASNLDQVVEKVGSDAIKFFVSDKHNPTRARSGFTSASLTTRGMVVKYHDQNGAELFVADTIPLRQKD